MTLRRRIEALARVLEWQAFDEAEWMEEQPKVCATLRVDGYVERNCGSKRRLPKHVAARQKLRLPAGISYWIRALGGSPRLCLHKGLDPKSVCVLEADILPQTVAPGVLPSDAPDLPYRLLVSRYGRGSSAASAGPCGVPASGAASPLSLGT